MLSLDVNPVCEIQLGEMMQAPREVGPSRLKSNKKSGSFATLRVTRTNINEPNQKLYPVGELLIVISAPLQEGVNHHHHIKNVSSTNDLSRALVLVTVTETVEEEPAAHKTK